MLDRYSIPELHFHPWGDILDYHWVLPVFWAWYHKEQNQSMHQLLWFFCRVVWQCLARMGTRNPQTGTSSMPKSPVPTKSPIPTLPPLCTLSKIVRLCLGSVWSSSLGYQHLPLQDAKEEQILLGPCTCWSPRAWGRGAYMKCWTFFGIKANLLFFFFSFSFLFVCVCAGDGAHGLVHVKHVCTTNLHSQPKA